MKKKLIFIFWADKISLMIEKNFMRKFVMQILNLLKNSQILKIIMN